MMRIWKALIALALLVPMGAYVAGSLVASADDPSPRPAIVIQDPDRTAIPSGSSSPPSPSPSGRVGEIELDPDDIHDDSDDWGRDDDDHFDDHGGDRSDDPSDDPSDDSGHGGDDHSGHGGGGDDD